MKKITQFFIVLALFGLSTGTKAQTVTWNIGSPNAEDVVATLNLADGTMIISGTGDMQDYIVIGDDINTPWYSEYNHNIKTVVIQDGVTSIGDRTFSYCTQLTSVIIGNSVVTIGEEAFVGSGLMSVTFGNSVSAIGAWAFSWCMNLTEVIIESYVTIIGDYAFDDCHYLTSVTIGNSVCTIGYNVFYNCFSLTEINVDVNNQNYSSEDGVLFNKDKTTLILYPKGKLGAYIIPSTVTAIGNYAFEDCYKLTEITIPNSVITIENNAFAHCDALEEIVIPNSITTIGNEAFLFCDWLKKVTIPNSVSSIGVWAFAVCYRLTDIYVSWTTPLNIGSDLFVVVDISSVRLHIPQGTLAAYQNAPVWQDFILVEDGTGVENIQAENIKLYPNPVKNELYIKSDNPIENVEICDLSGRQIANRKLSNSNSINVSVLPQGVYILKFGEYAGKFVKE